MEEGYNQNLLEIEEKRESLVSKKNDTNELCDIESDAADDENDDEIKENHDAFNGSGRTVTLQMLMSANVLQPGKSLMTIEYLGQKFIGDLLSDGKIKSQETETVFATPSAWAMHCKRIINPDKKSGCGWASVKYKGKKLDVYKNSWLRKCAQQKVDLDDLEQDADKKAYLALPAVTRCVFQHNTIINRTILHDSNMLIEAIPFSAIDKLQPFMLTLHSSALFMVDFHSHLTMVEVCGYFGGVWDNQTHTLKICKAYPCRNSLYDREKSDEVEKLIQKRIADDQLSLVGWYHSHPKFQAEPTLRDCDSQLDYQILMKGFSDHNYTPCISLIISPYYEDNPTLESVVKSIWIIPPNESKYCLEYGRPMLMQYSILYDSDISEDIRNEIQTCVDYYSQFTIEIVKFKKIFSGDTTYIEKLKNSLYPKFPTNQKHELLWNWICKILGCEQEKNFIPPNTIKINDGNDSFIEKSVDLKCKLKEGQPNDPLCGISRKTDPQISTNDNVSELKVLSLQEQLCLPSGLNMNPVRIMTSNTTQNSTNTDPTSIIPGLIPTQIASTGKNSVINNDQNINDDSTTVQLISPVKTDLLVCASPSPSKSDSSHTSRARYSPSHSPNKLGIIDFSRNITSNKFEISPFISSAPPSGISGATDVISTGIPHYSGRLTPIIKPTDISSLLSHRKDFGISSINQPVSSSHSVSLQKSNECTDVAINSIATPDFCVEDPNGNNSRSQDRNSQKEVNSENRSLKFSCNATYSLNSYKTKLMKELENIKNDPIKMAELLRSPEYAALLLQQAEALGATTLGTLGLNADFNYMNTVSDKNKSSSSVTHSANYTNLFQTSKLFGFSPFVEQTKNEEINSIDKKIGDSTSVTIPVTDSTSLIKKQNEFDTLLQTYTKICDTGIQLDNVAKDSDSNKISALIGSNVDNGLGSSYSSVIQKHKDIRNQLQHQSDMIHNFLGSDKSPDFDALLYHKKIPSNLSVLFATPMTSSTSSVASSNKSSSSVVTFPADTSLYYSSLAQEKIQNYATFFKQHDKFTTSDALSKSSLVANHNFMSPTHILKMQESLPAMMKPPKVTNSNSIKNCENSSSPVTETVTPTKSININHTSKYNFQAADLAISSVSSNTPSPAPSDSSNSSTHLRILNTPPVDFGRLHDSLQSNPTTGSKKRMEFSSIADLVAPPSKLQKTCNEILNLSNE